MPLDLSRPVSLLPLGSLADATATAQPPPRRGIALKMTEEVLEQVQLILKSLGRGEQAPKGAMRVDLGPVPVSLTTGSHRDLASFGGADMAFRSQVLIINEISYPIRVDGESSHSEIVRQQARPSSSNPAAARDLQPIATVQHKVTVKPGAGNLNKVGQSLRENREAAEKEREGRR